MSQRRKPKCDDGPVHKNINCMQEPANITSNGATFKSSTFKALLQIYQVPNVVKVLPPSMDIQ